jgi:hypothetical protein
VCSAAIRLDGGEFDHWYSRAQNRVTQTWLVCRDCNQRLLDTGFKAAARSAFEAYQMALRPFLGNRQMPLRLMESPTGKPGWRHKRKATFAECFDTVCQAFHGLAQQRGM